MLSDVRELSRELQGALVSSGAPANGECPSSEELLGWFDGSPALPAGRLKAIGTHIDSCPACLHWVGVARLEAGKLTAEASVASSGSIPVQLPGNPPGGLSGTFISVIACYLAILGSLLLFFGDLRHAIQDLRPVVVSHPAPKAASDIRFRYRLRNERIWREVRLPAEGALPRLSSNYEFSLRATVAQSGWLSLFAAGPGGGLEMLFSGRLVAHSPADIPGPGNWLPAGTKPGTYRYWVLLSPRPENLSSLGPVERAAAKDGFAFRLEIVGAPAN